MTVVLIIVAAVVVIAVVWAVVTYNRLVRLSVSADEGESEIDVQLKRRHDLIPNLVETVKGYASHERGTFEQVTKARGAAISAQGARDRAAAEGELSQALGRLLAVAEAYPDLKANQNFLELQRELTATEDRIQAARRFYNTQVEALNTKIQSLPSKIVARMGNFREREFFELEDRADAEVPSVTFDPGPEGGSRCYSTTRSGETGGRAGRCSRGSSSSTPRSGRRSASRSPVSSRRAT